MKIIGAKPRPRALIHGFGDAMASAVADHFPTSKIVAESSPLANILQAEWDILVTACGVPAALAPHIFVLAIGGSSLGLSAGQPELGVSRRLISPADELVVPSWLPIEIRELVQSDLVEATQAYKEMHGYHNAMAIDWASEHVTDRVEPFLLTGDAHPVAGRFRRAGGRGVCWSVPEYGDPLRWIQLALPHWSEVNPERVPIVIDWAAKPDWETPVEQALRQELQDLRAKTAQVVKEYAQDAEKLQARLASAIEEANSGIRQLLTARGDALVTRVAEALEELGFVVTNMDDRWPPGERREDLRVASPDSGTWEAIVEVRAYKGGASVNDLLRLSRFRTRYLQDEGRLPDASWYIVNPYRESDPSDRPPVLASNDAELSTAAEDGGLAVDTAALYRLVMQVRRGIMSRVEARQALGQASGRFDQ